MSILSRPSVVFAIVFGCFAVLVPRVFLPLLRTKPAAPARNLDDHFQRPHPAMSRGEHGDTIEHVSGTPPHMRGAHPSMRMHHPGVDSRQQTSTDHSSSKSVVTLALPMYTVGIGIFFIYTCCKYWSRKSPDDKITKGSYSKKHSSWKTDKQKLEYDILDKDSEEEQENKEDFYAGLDPDYVEYLKLKKQKALEAERIMTDEQKQMHYALEEMKKSLSFISSKLVTKENRGNLNGDEIVQLQERLVSTETQMCKILTALDSASDKVNDITKNTKKSQKAEEEHYSISKSSSEDEVNPHEEENLSSSDEEDEVSNHGEDENEYNRENYSNSLSSSNSSLEDDQSAPIDEQNRLIRRKHH